MKVVRRHYLVMIPAVLLAIFVALVPLILERLILSGFLPFSSVLIDPVTIFVREWGTFVYSLWLLVVWVTFFVEWTDYYLDLWIITNKRIIDVQQIGFFHREVTSFSYDRIQDITIETRGVIETLLKFGTLHIQTAGHNREIIIKDAYHPEDARSLILRLQGQARSI